MDSFDIFESWSTSGELFPGSLAVEEYDLRLLLDDITSPHSHPFTRYELKDDCQYDANRVTLRQTLQDLFISALEKMMHDDNEDTIRFAIFVILTFAQDQASWSGYVDTVYSTVLWDTNGRCSVRV